MELLPPQFSLRSLLIVVTLLAVLFAGWVALNQIGDYVSQFDIPPNRDR